MGPHEARFRAAGVSESWRHWPVSVLDVRDLPLLSQQSGTTDIRVPMTFIPRRRCLTPIMKPWSRLRGLVSRLSLGLYFPVLSKRCGKCTACEATRKAEEWIAALEGPQ